jgi:ferric-dicitrate binding protein FerR (iron transport regulator)
VTAFEDRPTTRARRPRRRRRPWLRALAALVAAAALFLVGVAVGMALHDDPEPGGTVTIVRTLEPLPQVPANP